MNRLVYESKGASLKQLNDLKVGVLGSVILAAIMLFKAYSTVTEHQYYMSKDEEALMIFYISMFAAFLVIAVVYVKLVSFCKTCWIKLYEDYLEAKTFTSVLKIEISRIDYVQINKFNLFVTAGGKREKIICDEPEKLYSVLNELISHSRNTNK